MTARRLMLAAVVLVLALAGDVPYLLAARRNRRALYGQS